jgi:aspartyl aminopeptidase
VPLELHGVVALTDGTVREVNIGADPSDPPRHHGPAAPSGRASRAKSPSEAIPAETPEHAAGQPPIGDEEGGENRVKLAVMQLLHEKYGFTEEDFTSAELEAVPAA